MIWRRQSSVWHSIHRHGQHHNGGDFFRDPFDDTVPFEDGGDLFGVLSPDPGQWTLFDFFIVAPFFNFIIDDFFVLDQTAWDMHRIGGASPDNGLFFAGPNAAAANGRNPVGFYTSFSFFEPASSVSHLDDENPMLAGLLMLAFADTGLSARPLSGIEIGIYEDLGYILVAPEPSVVPEPSTLLLFVVGIPGIIGMGWWRRKKAA